MKANKIVTVVLCMTVFVIPAFARMAIKHISYNHHQGQELSTALCEKIFQDYTASFDTDKNEWVEDKVLPLGNNFYIANHTKLAEYIINDNLKLVSSGGTTHITINGKPISVPWIASGLLERTTHINHGILISKACTVDFIDTEHYCEAC